MQKILIICSIFCILINVVRSQSNSTDPEEETSWKEWKKKYGKNYPSATEEQKRRDIFKESFKQTKQNKLDFQNGKVPFEMALNKFADKTPEEIKQMKGFKKYPNIPSSTQSPATGRKKRATPPASMDWRTKNVVTAVSDQGDCGSCYTFAATGAIEGRVSNKLRKLINLSEQSGVDCTRVSPYDNSGCDGGYMESIYDFVKNKKGQVLASNYPYVGIVQACKSISTMTKYANVTGYKYITDEANLLTIVGTVGPVAIAMDTSRNSFMMYSSGIYSDSYCSKYYLDHAMLVVGYGTDANGVNYWIVKNSWGTDWGINGYIHIIRGKNMCGIVESGTYPILA